jgi:hypothetical protein
VFAKSLRIDHFEHKAVLGELFQHYYLHSKEATIYEHLVQTLSLCPFDKVEEEGFVCLFWIAFVLRLRFPYSS